MGFLDDAKEKLTNLAGEHPDKVEEFSDKGLDGAADNPIGREVTGQVDGFVLKGVAKRQRGLHDRHPLLGLLVAE